MPLRLAPVEPNAPHLISASIAFLLTVRLSTRSQKSHSELNSPPSLARPLDRLDRLVADALDGIQAEADVAHTTIGSAFRAACPGASTVNSWSERLTSGGSISMPISSQRATKKGTLSLVDITEEISAAMYSAVWLAFSHAVR